MSFSGPEEIRTSRRSRKLHHYRGGTKIVTTSSMSRRRSVSLDDNSGDRFPDDYRRRRARQRPRPSGRETYDQMSSPGDFGLHSPETTGTVNTTSNTRPSSSMTESRTLELEIEWDTQEERIIPGGLGPEQRRYRRYHLGT